MLACIVICAIVVLYVLPKILKGYNGRCYSGACLVGKTAVVTGGNSGVGFQIALNLASRGCRVIIADCDDSEKNCRKIIEESDNENIISKIINLDSLQSVRDFAKDILESEQRLDILFNNAGCACSPGEYTKDGLLRMVQINYFSHFLLVHLLLDLLKKTPNSRIIFTSSIVAFNYSIKKAEDLNKKTNAFLSFSNISSEYSNSKLAMVMCTKVLAKRLKKYGILCYSLHPGIVNSSLYSRAYDAIGNKSLDLFLYYFTMWSNTYIFGKDVEEGAQTSLHCALSKDIEQDSGKYFIDCKPFWFPPPAADDNYCEEIYKLSEKLVRLDPHEKITYTDEPNKFNLKYD